MRTCWIMGLILCLAASVPTAGAGTVSGAIKVTGTLVKTEGAKSQKDVVVYLEKVGEGEYPSPPAEHASIDQTRLVFVPHVLAIQAGMTVDFKNSDTTEHNIFSVDDCCDFDLGTFAGGQSASRQFDVPGAGVMLCKLHPEMSAYVIVLETPYFVVAQVDGATQTAAYTIENVPAGNYVLKTWNKRCESPEQEITVGEGDETKADVELVRKTRKRRRKR